MTMKARITTILALLIIAVTSSWAQDEVTVTAMGNANEWTFEMPEADVELEVEYYTEEELYEEGVELTKTADGEWTLAAMPAFDVEIEVEYYTDEELYEEGVELTKTAEGEWTLAEMPAFDVELEVEYYTELKEDEAIDYDAIGSTADIWLSRTLKTGSWNTFASPVAIDADQLTALGITAVKQLSTSSFSEGVLTLNFADATEIEAGKPYLVKVGADKEIGAFDGATVSGTGVTTETTAVNFVPTLEATTITGDDANDILFLSSGNTLLHPTALRAYFLLKGEAALAKAFRMDFGDGEATGIISIENAQPATSSAVYDLQGRRVSGNAQKGVYIVNGKKTVIK